MTTKEIILRVTNKADNYRILEIEPLGYKFGMSPDETFKLQIASDEEFSLSMYEDPKNMIFTFENYQFLEVKVFSDNEEISSGYNILLI